jgi:flagellar biosynthetic protein FliR
MLTALQNLVPVFLLVFFRLAGMALFAPLFGSARIPKRVRLLLILVLAMAMTTSVKPPPQLPDNAWDAAIGIAGEMAFGLAMGTIMSFVFIACQWAGEIIGQQMGLNLGEVFDPSFGAQASLIGDLYFMLTLVVFLAVGGHRVMLQAVHTSFEVLPLLSLGMNASLLHLLTGLLQTSTIMAMRLAAPMLITMLVVDLILGLIGKTVPQMNVMAAGLSLRSLVGMFVVIIGLTLTTRVMRESVLQSMQTVWDQWSGVQ